MLLLGESKVLHRALGRRVVLKYVSSQRSKGHPGEYQPNAIHFVFPYDGTGNNNAVLLNRCIGLSCCCCFYLFHFTCTAIPSHIFFL